MILPTKYILSRQSLLGVGALLLPRLKEPTTLSTLWVSVREIPGIITFERFILALNLLYSLGLVEMDDGILKGMAE
jgi:hypothetical protein